MRYLGGKWRQGKDIAANVVPMLDMVDRYIEPFCGAWGSSYWVTRLMKERGIDLPITLSDAHAGLIRMWQAVVYEGWIPPASLSYDDYKRLKDARDNTDPLTAFAGFGNAFMGMYFATFAAGVASGTRNQVLKKAAAVAAIEPLVDIRHCSYQAYAGTKGALFYLDPPYAGRAAQSKEVPKHDPVEFWDFARKLSEDNIVMVSEFTYPEDFAPIHVWGDTVSMRHDASTASAECEVLVVPKKHLPGGESTPTPT